MTTPFSIQIKSIFSVLFFLQPLGDGEAEINGRGKDAKREEEEYGGRGRKQTEEEERREEAQ